MTVIRFEESGASVDSMQIDPGSEPDFATTFRSGMASEKFAARAEVLRIPEGLDRLPRPGFSLRDEVTLFSRVLRAARRHRTLLLFSSRGYFKPELLASLVLGWLPRRWRPTIVMYGEMYEPSGGWRGVIERLMMGGARRGIARYVLFSNQERPLFSAAWGVPFDKTAACLCFLPDIDGPQHFVAPADEGDLPVAPGERYVFAGGSSFRDYGPVIEAARRLPEVTFVLCAAGLEGSALPANVRLGSLEQAVYRPLLDRATVVLVPLITDLKRPAGMFTYLRAMQLGKPTIVTDALAVREYVDDGANGIVVEPTPDAYAKAIRHVLDPANAQAIAVMCHNAQASVDLRHSITAYADRMLEILDQAVAESRRGRAGAHAAKQRTS